MGVKGRAHDAGWRVTVCRSAFSLLLWGAFVCLVGAILALAVMMAAIVYAYEDLFGADLLPPPQTFASSPGDKILGTGKCPGEL